MVRRSLDMCSAETPANTPKTPAWFVLCLSCCISARTRAIVLADADGSRRSLRGPCRFSGRASCLPPPVRSGHAHRPSSSHRATHSIDPKQRCCTCSSSSTIRISVNLRAREGRSLPDHVQEESDAYLECGRLEEGFLRVRCGDCHAEKLVAFSCKKRGLCPSCGGRRMSETASLLADEVLPERPLPQWVLSLPYALRFLLATDPDSLTLVLRT